MIKRSMLAVLAVVMLAFAAMASTATAAKPGSAAATVTGVTGTFTDALGGTGTFTGTYTIQRVVTQSGELAAVATVSGTATDSAGNVVATATNERITAPLQVSGTCQVLHLELGPLDLDLLGLVVHLDPVVLDITAEQGPGNLLGNLLCAVAGLLDSPGGLSGLLNQVAALLNQILAALGG